MFYKSKFSMCVHEELVMRPGQTSVQLREAVGVNEGPLAYLVKTKRIYRVGGRPWLYFPDEASASVIGAQLIQDIKQSRKESKKALKIKWEKNNKATVELRLKKWQRKQREELGPSYLAKLLDMKTKDVPQSLLDMKKQQLETRRLARHLRKATDESSKNVNRVA